MAHPIRAHNVTPTRLDVTRAQRHSGQPLQNVEAATTTVLTTAEVSCGPASFESS
eukprot:m.1546 g.1546  ORF g.1546 m.1546 type:complete len:55 (+) comp529_c0_seq1:80-244(+)